MFKTETISGTQIINYKLGDFSFEYIKGLEDKPYKIISKRIENVDYEKYKDMMNEITKLKKYSNATLRPEGDLDTVNILTHPKTYNLTMKKAFELLKKGKKEINYNLVMRF